MNTNSNLSNGINSLLLKLKDSEAENEMLKKEIKKLRLEKEKEKIIAQNVESGLKQLLNQIEYHVDNLNSSYESSFTGSIISSIVDIIWKLFNYETCTTDVKEINHRLREKLNKKLLNSTVVSSENDYICNESFNEKLTNAKIYSVDMNFLMHEATLLKDKVAQQTLLIKSLIESFKNQNLQNYKNDHSVSFVVSSLTNTTNQTTEFTSTSTCTTTTSQEDDYEDNYKLESEKKKTNRQYFICPKCEIQIDKKEVTFNKFEQHVYKCEPSKLVCIFCLEIFDLKQEAEFDQHIQRHLRYVDDKKQADNLNYLTEYNNAKANICMMRSNSSNSGSCSTNSSSNLVSSFSSRSNSNSNMQASNSTDTDFKANLLIQSQAASPASQQQQQQKNTKNCLLIQNFEPKIRKRL